ncbi:hypothetical protein [Lysobacter sp. N42]|uniref:hypothetical protein n=1 Tax=Lysobacter sp. N42 TaxID=2545719 RepID=UPI00104E3CF3|nr:hypothetical protein [Lysobacter sp. N42]TCZ82867.1 hypothetical protein EYQ95_22320 [Lysobacter sp. N42]
MSRLVKPLAVAGLALAVAALVLAASSVRATRPAPEAGNADLLPPPAQLRLSRASSGPVAPASVTVDQVGDVDSFGRNLRWLGVTNAFITLAPTCDPTDPTPCQALSPSPASTAFDFTDTVRIELPKKATNSLFCYWFSPVLTVNWQNATASPVVGRLVINPTLTVENPVLDDPALIDPGTGAPFGGRLETGMTSSERFEVPMAPGVAFTERTRDSAVCIAGFITRRNLIDGYGLTPAQADEFFKKPTTVKLNVRGSAQHVGFASLVFGLRIIGD